MMRKVLISLAAAALALAIASPASAQWAPPPPPGYGYGYDGQGYGYGRDNYGQVRVLQARIHQLRQQINHSAGRRGLSAAEARILRGNVSQLDHALARAARNGLNQREAYRIQRQIAVVQERIRAEARDGRGGWDGRDRYGDDYYGDRGRGGDRWDDRDDDDDRGRGRGRGRDRD